MKGIELLEHAQRLQALAQAGLAFSSSPYDLERYTEIRGIAAVLLQALSDEPIERILGAFASELGYQTPKVDVRAVLFRGVDEILLVGEKSDGGRWTLPGGWADVGYSPFEVAIKEAREESGLEVEPRRLLALLDKRKHAHPVQPWYVYKAFIQCDVTGGALTRGTLETTEARWFSRQDLDGIQLSTDRTTLSQLRLMFEFALDPAKATVCD